MLQKIVRKWKQYRYRFVPWIALNLKDRSVRSIPTGGTDKLVSDDVVDDTLKTFFSDLYNGHKTQSSQGANHSKCNASPTKNKTEGNRVHCSAFQGNKQTEICGKNRSHMDALVIMRHHHSLSKENSPGVFELSSCSKCKIKRTRLEHQHSPGHRNVISEICTKMGSTHKHYSSGDVDSDITASSKRQYGCADSEAIGLAVMRQSLGFTIERHKSVVPGGGTGVIVTSGVVPKGTVVAMYPGAIYYPSEPILLQSIGNPFVFRCIDSLLIDGNDKSISRFLYRSCSQRDRVGGYFVCDMSWLTPHPANPMAVGQYVNNHNKSYPANVAYQEFDVPQSFPFHLRQFIPNVYYSSSMVSTQERLVRTVVLVSLRDISEGEELFSTYFTVVH